MANDHATRGLPHRWLLPPAPRDPGLAKAFAALSFADRQDLARRGPNQLDELPPDRRELVAALAEARLATSWRLRLSAPVLGWLVLMTIWGFGRATYPQDAMLWFVSGSVAGGLVWLATALAVSRRLRRTRELLATIDSR